MYVQKRGDHASAKAGGSTITDSKWYEFREKAGKAEVKHKGDWKPCNPLQYHLRSNLENVAEDQVGK